MPFTISYRIIEGGCHCPFYPELKKSKNGQKIGQNGQNGHRKNGQKGQKRTKRTKNRTINGHRIGHNVQTKKTDKK